MKPITSTFSVRSALYQTDRDLVEVIHGLADNQDLNSWDLSLKQYRDLILEKADATLAATGDDSQANQTAKEYADKLNEIANAIKLR